MHVKLSKIIHSSCEAQSLLLGYTWHVKRALPGRSRFFTKTRGLTKILPVVVWPEISSPAQSFASVTHPISVSGPFNPGFWGLPGFWTVLAFLWQQSHAKIRHDKTRSNPTKNVIKLEQRKAYQCLSSRHTSSAVFTVTLASGILTALLHSSIQKISYFSFNLSKNMLSNILSASISHTFDVRRCWPSSG